MITERKWPWIARQVWNDLLFMHWSVPYEAIRPYVPEPFEIETYEGQAWVSVVPFKATFNGPRGLPGKIPFSNFLELNLRTYVSYKGESGVYFFSFDADSPVAVKGARTIFSLPYLHADMNIKKKQGTIHYTSQRTHRDYPKAHFSARYKPEQMQAETAEKGSLTEWLVERYCLWTLIGGHVYKGPILHSPWDLKRVEAEWEMDEFVDFIGKGYFQDQPILHYCRKKKVKFFPFEKKEEAGTDFNELTYLKKWNLEQRK